MDIIDATVEANILPEVGELTLGGQMTLWAVRIWVQAHAGVPALHNTLRTAFTLMKAPEAHLALDGAMTYIATSARIGIKILCPQCQQIGPDEQTLLQLLAELQTGQAVTAYGRLTNWLHPSAVPSAFAACLDYASLLQERRLMLKPHGHGTTPLVGGRSLLTTATQAAALH